MHSKTHGKPGIDIVQDLIEAGLLAFPVSSLMISFYKQHRERGFLTKKQLQGLHSKLSAAAEIDSGKLATLEAMIKRMPNRYKSEKPVLQEVQDPDAADAALLATVLEVFPAHKRAFFLTAQHGRKEPFTAKDKTEIKAFYQLALKKMKE